MTCKFNPGDVVRVIATGDVGEIRDVNIHNTESSNYMYILKMHPFDEEGNPSRLEGFSEDKLEPNI